MSKTKLSSKTVITLSNEKVTLEGSKYTRSIDIEVYSDAIIIKTSEGAFEVREKDIPWFISTISGLVEMFKDQEFSQSWVPEQEDFENID